MPYNAPLTEFRTVWLPHATTSGLKRLLGLLETANPLLIHGAFTRAMPMGCLATHLAWHHPITRHLNEEAGVWWLTHVAGLNPATSSVIVRWDREGIHDRELRSDLIEACRTELARRVDEPDDVLLPCASCN
ncbi:hypothetical protein [Fimbriiglobus ruber]|nr:hypothetical protein [Fimbriiglobus ruber]